MAAPVTRVGTGGGPSAPAGTAGCLDAVRLQATLRHSRLMVYNCDLDLRYTWIANPHPDFSVERLIGRRDDEVAEPEAVAELIRFKQGVLDRGMSAQSEIAFSHAGRTRWYELMAEPLRDGDGLVCGLTVTALDVTDQKRVEEERAQLERELRDERTRLEQIIENTPVGLIVAEAPSGRILTYNRQAEAILGHSVIPARGHEEYGLYGGIHPDGRPFAPHEYATAQALLTGRSVQQLEYLYRRGDGRVTQLSVNAAPVSLSGEATDAIVCTFIDIDARRAAEQALREGEKRLRLAQEAGKVGSWEYDVAQARTFWSPYTYRLYGRDPETWTTTLESWLSLVHPDDRASAEANALRALADGQAAYHEFRAVLPDGSVRAILSRYQPETDEGGRVVRVLGADIDITDLRTAEAALVESEARFRDMADGAPVMVWVTDPDGQCLYLNRLWHAFTGQQPGEGLGLGWLDATHPEDRPAAEREFLEANRRQGPFRTEYRLRRSDGTYRWVIDAATPRFSAEGTFLGYVGSVIDITDHKEIEDRLKSSEERFRTLANLVPSLVWLAGPDGGITYLNDRWYEYSGQTPENAMPDGWTRAVHPDDAAAVETAWSKALGSGEPYSMEIRFRRHDGVYRWYVARALPLRDKAGRITGWFGTDTDIHDLKTAEETLRALNASLEERVRLEVAERQRVQDALLQAQKTEALGQLTGGVAHDFNNLLQALAGCLHMIERRAVGDAGVRPIIEAGFQAVDRGTKLVQQLLTFARRQVLHPEPVAVRDRIHAMSDLLNRALRADIRLNLDLSPGLWPAMVDPLQFEMALINLVVNARDAMPGGGTVTIAARNMVRPAGDPVGLPGEFVQVSVADTGCGMAPEVIARAFDPFFTTKEVGKGTGLGLSQVYGLAVQSGGTAWIESAPDRGTTVMILLRRAESGHVAIEGTASEAGHGPRQGRILMVEDDPIVATTVGDALAEAGYNLEQVVTAGEAMARLSRTTFDLVFSDVVMPGGLSGVDLASWIRTRFPNIPIILTTGYSEDIASAPGVQVLSKPYRIADLLRAIDTSLAGQPCTTGEP